MESKGERLEIGEVDGDYVGCYLMGIENPEGEPSYHSIATSKQRLLEDCQELLTDVAKMTEQSLGRSPAPLRSRFQHQLDVVRNLLDNLESSVDMHLATDMNEPLLTLPGLRIFLCVGARRRQKWRGKYIE